MRVLKLTDLLVELGSGNGNGNGNGSRGWNRMSWTEETETGGES